MTKCGCFIDSHSLHPKTIECNKQVCPDREELWIVYCPLHESAEDILTELKQEHGKVIDDLPGGWDGRCHTDCSTCKLIAKAEAKV